MSPDEPLPHWDKGSISKGAVALQSIPAKIINILLIIKSFHIRTICLY